MVKFVTDQVAFEVQRATELHAGFNSLHEAKSVIEEEFDEFWDLVKLNPKKMTDEQREKWRKDIRDELIQTAAMCVRTIIDCKL